MFGQKSGSKGGGVDIVEASFPVEKKIRNPKSGSLEGPDLVCQREAGIRGAKPWERAALVGVERVSGVGDGGKPHRHDPFEDL